MGSIKNNMALPRICGLLGNMKIFISYIKSAKNLDRGGI